jgi:hypothetical protein
VLGAAGIVTLVGVAALAGTVGVAQWTGVNRVAGVLGPDCGGGRGESIDTFGNAPRGLRPRFAPVPRPRVGVGVDGVLGVIWMNGVGVYGVVIVDNQVQPLRLRLRNS